ncbi:MAG TPA: DMT family transporter [Gammaproteobacteria bacterium]|nr:DMT family transporter [Gammaproteobacteria bacterium]
MSSNHSSHLPVLSLLLGATLWGVIWYPLRLLEQHGMAGLWTSLIMYLAALVISLPVLWRCRAELSLHPWLLLMLALSAGWCNVSFVLAVIEGNVVRVLLLFYLSPLWAALLGWLLLGERLSRFAWATFALAMLGALIMLWDMDGGLPMPEQRADWLAIGAGFTFALSNVLVRKGQAVSVAVKTIAVWWGGTLLALLGILLTSVPAPDLSAANVTAAVGLGWFGIVIMTFAVQYGVTHMPVHRSAVILLFELVAGAVSASLLSNEIIHARDWIGGALVICAAYLSARQH